MRKLKAFLEKNHPSGLVDIDYFNSPVPDSKYLAQGWWSPTAPYLGRIFLDSINGDDNNDGSSWALAVKTLQSAFDLIPPIIDREWYILMPGGTQLDKGGIIHRVGSTKSAIPGVSIAVCLGTMTSDFHTNNGEVTTFPVTQAVINVGDTAIDYQILGASVSQFLSTTGDGTPYEWGGLKIVAGSPDSSMSIFGGTIRSFGVIYDMTGSTSYSFVKIWGGKFDDVGSDFIGINNGTGVWRGFFFLASEYSPVALSVALSHLITFNETFFSKGFTGTSRFNGLGQFVLVGGDFTFRPFLPWSVALAINETDCDFSSGAIVYINKGANGHIFVKGSVGGSVTFQGTRNLSIQYSDGNFLFPVLPTSDPLIVGALWNNLGVVTVSAG